MSRNNDGLPMLPPWLSESEVTEVGYEAPVENLPHDDLIPEKKSRGGLFGRRKNRKDTPEPEPIEREPVQIPPTPAWNERAPWSPNDAHAPESEPPPGIPPRPEQEQRTQGVPVRPEQGQPTQSFPPRPEQGGIPQRTEQGQPTQSLPPRPEQGQGLPPRPEQSPTTGVPSRGSQEQQPLSVPRRTPGASGHGQQPPRYDAPPAPSQGQPPRFDAPPSQAPQPHPDAPNQGQRPPFDLPPAPNHGRPGDDVSPVSPAPSHGQAGGSGSDVSPAPQATTRFDLPPAPPSASTGTSTNSAARQRDLPPSPTSSLVGHDLPQRPDANGTQNGGAATGQPPSLPARPPIPEAPGDIARGGTSTPEVASPENQAGARPPIPSAPPSPNGAPAQNGTDLPPSPARRDLPPSPAELRARQDDPATDPTPSLPSRPPLPDAPDNQAPAAPQQGGVGLPPAPAVGRDLPPSPAEARARQDDPSAAQSSSLPPRPPLPGAPDNQAINGATPQGGVGLPPSPAVESDLPPSEADVPARQDDSANGAASSLPSRPPFPSAPDGAAEGAPSRSGGQTDSSATDAPKVIQRLPLAQSPFDTRPTDGAQPVVPTPVPTSSPVSQGFPSAAPAEPTTKMSVADAAVQRPDRREGSDSAGRHRAVDTPAPAQPDSAQQAGTWGAPSTAQPTPDVANQPPAPRPDHQGAAAHAPLSPNGFAPQPNQLPPHEQGPYGYAPQQGPQDYAQQQRQPGPVPQQGQPEQAAPQGFPGTLPPQGQPEFAPQQGQPEFTPQQGHPEFAPNQGQPEYAPQQGQPNHAPQQGPHGYAPQRQPDPNAQGPNSYGQAPGYGTPPPAQQYGNPAAARGNPAPSLDNFPMRRAKKAPGSGWRKAVHHMSGGTINPGMSAEERRLQELVARIRQPVRGDYRIAVLSLKGGVGKTTTTMGLGSIFSSIRGDRVIAVDANPDFGTLSQRVPLQTRSTVRDLLLDESIRSYSDVRRHTSQSTSRLEVLASERDPAASESFSEDEYRNVTRILQRYYNIILTDCGTGLMHSAMAGVLDLAHSLVLISSSAIDGARSAAATLDWLSLHGHDHLVRNAVVVINLPREGSPNVGIQQLREYFLSRCRAVHIIPFDEHLAEGAEIDLHRLHKNTKRALVELSATVADDFGSAQRRYRG
ncbi:AAA family ATPase [Nocardia sp. NPDC050406]|uniref:nucleotide-binding protein n=1 Tax=Nocardia sp. NPDC050406 TaxID=3364318 RepID=UPI0037ACC0C2